MSLLHFNTQSRKITGRKIMLSIDINPTSKQHCYSITQNIDGKSTFEFLKTVTSFHMNEDGNDNGHIDEAFIEAEKSSSLL